MLCANQVTALNDKHKPGARSRNGKEDDCKTQDAAIWKQISRKGDNSIDWLRTGMSGGIILAVCAPGHRRRTERYFSVMQYGKNGSLKR